MRTSTLAKTTGVLLAAGASVLAFSLPASATSHSYTKNVTAAWHADGLKLNQDGNGDDLAVNVTNTSGDMFIRWIKCGDSSVHGHTFHIVGANQGAVTIGTNFKAGTCLDLQSKSAAGANSGTFNMGVYWDYNIE